MFGHHLTNEDPLGSEISDKQTIGMVRLIQTSHLIIILESMERERIHINGKLSQVHNTNK